MPNAKSFFYNACALVFLFTFCIVAVSADGVSRDTSSKTSLRVCADPNNLPFSNDKLEGFENEILALISEKLNRPLKYTWFPQTIGYVRNTLQLNRCDLISGITVTNERVQNTNPYYHSVYSLVYLKTDQPVPIDFSDQFYQGKKIGLVAGTPAANLMAAYGLLPQIVPYHLTIDTRYFSVGQKMIDDLVTNVIDAAIIWGPIAGFYADKSDKEIVVVPLVEEQKNIKLDFGITMAVRYNDQDFKLEVNQVLADIEPEITVILNKYNVPLINNLGQIIQVELSESN